MVSVADRVRMGVVVAPGIWWNKLSSDISNANVTTSSALTDVGGGATFFDNLVEVQPTIVDETA
jgi:anaerobic selenocysteine-containing dehydrogenase